MPISVKTAGQKGAAALKKKYGKDYFSNLAKKGVRKRKAAARKAAKAAR